jgi:thiol-disulfide isomerase/thioredoxin
MSPALRNLLLLMTTVLALVAGYWMAQAMHPSASPPVTTPSYGGGTMIDFTLPDLEGNSRSLKEWRGKVIVLNFWATWCPPCREEIPLFIALQKEHAADGLEVIGVAVDNKTSVMAYRQSAGINYTILMGGDDAMDLAAKYGDRMDSLPYSVIISRSGSIEARKLGAFDEPELNGLIEPLLAARR